MRRNITPELNTFATYELCYGNAFTTNQMDMECDPVDLQ